MSSKKRKNEQINKINELKKAQKDARKAAIDEKKNIDEQKKINRAIEEAADAAEKSRQELKAIRKAAEKLDLKAFRHKLNAEILDILPKEEKRIEILVNNIQEIRDEFTDVEKKYSQYGNSMLGQLDAILDQVKPGKSAKELTRLKNQCDQAKDYLKTNFVETKELLNVYNQYDELGNFIYNRTVEQSGFIKRGLKLIGRNKGNITSVVAGLTANSPLAMWATNALFNVKKQADEEDDQARKALINNKRTLRDSFKNKGKKSSKKGNKNIIGGLNNINANTDDSNSDSPIINELVEIKNIMRSLFITNDKIYTQGVKEATGRQQQFAFMKDKDQHDKNDQKTRDSAAAEDANENKPKGFQLKSEADLNKAIKKNGFISKLVSGVLGGAGLTTGIGAGLGITALGSNLLRAGTFGAGAYNAYSGAKESKEDGKSMVSGAIAKNILPGIAAGVAGYFTGGLGAQAAFIAMTAIQGFLPKEVHEFLQNATDKLGEGINAMKEAWRMNHIQARSAEEFGNAVWRDDPHGKWAKEKLKQKLKEIAKNDKIRETKKELEKYNGTEYAGFFNKDENKANLERELKFLQDPNGDAKRERYIFIQKKKVSDKEIEKLNEKRKNLLAAIDDEKNDEEQRKKDRDELKKTEDEIKKKTAEINKLKKDMLAKEAAIEKEKKDEAARLAELKKNLEDYNKLTADQKKQRENDKIQIAEEQKRNEGWAIPNSFGAGPIGQLQQIQQTANDSANMWGGGVTQASQSILGGAMVPGGAMQTVQSILGGRTPMSSGGIMPLPSPLIPGQSPTLTGQTGNNRPVATPGVNQVSPVGSMTVSKAGLDAIKAKEGFDKVARWDVNGYALGYGSHYHLDGSPVKPGDTTNEAEASKVLEQRINTEYTKGIRDNIKSPLNQNQFDALASVSWNAGPASVGANSDLTKSINAGDFAGAAQRMQTYRATVDGQPSAALLDRRNAEAALFSSGQQGIAGAGEPYGTGLKVKGGPGGQAFASGKSLPGTMDMAKYVQSNVSEFDQFTGFNDEYHKGKGGHGAGRSFDFTVKNKQEAAAVASQLRTKLKSLGINATVIDEYNNPSPGSTGGHIHAQFNTAEDAQSASNILNQQTGAGQVANVGYNQPFTTTTDGAWDSFSDADNMSFNSDMGAFNQKQSSGISSTDSGMAYIGKPQASSGISGSASGMAYLGKQSMGSTDQRGLGTSIPDQTTDYFNQNAQLSSNQIAAGSKSPTVVMPQSKSGGGGGGGKGSQTSGPVTRKAPRSGVNPAHYQSQQSDIPVP